MPAYKHTYIATLAWIAWLAYIGLGLDVGSSLAQQSHHLGVTVKSGSGQGGEPTLSDSKKRDTHHYQIKSGQVRLNYTVIALAAMLVRYRTFSTYYMAAIQYLYAMLYNLCIPQHSSMETQHEHEYR